ncbi:MAG: DUF6057 family protein [Phycisphaerae bacterium]|nr:DUF6057 family protein [Phycisphaerae bacterium]
MLNPSGKLSNQDIIEQIRDFVVFALFYLYLWLGVDLRFIYSGGGEISNFPVFYRGWPFLEKFLSQPGGPVEYAASFLSQLFCIGWAGALVVTVLAWLICVCTDSIIKTIKAPRLRLVRFIPTIIFLALYSSYIHHLVITSALLTAMLFVCLYLKTNPKSVLHSLIYFIVLSVILYYIAGGAYLLFAALCAIYELFFTRRRQLGLLYLLSAAAIPYVEGVLVLGASVNDAFGNLLPFSWKTLFFGFPRKMLITLYILYLFLPVTMLGWGLWKIFVRQSDQPGTSEANSGEAKKTTEEESNKGILSTIIESRVLFVVVLFAALFTYKNPLKAVFAVDHYSYEGNWPKVLSAALHHPGGNVAAHAANRALYHTNRLGDDMFRYSHNPDVLFMNTKRYNYAYWLRFDTYIELGFTGLAELDLIEAMGTYGERPMVLKRLALVNMIKNSTGAARTYLGALSKTLFDSDWANDYLARLESDPNLSADKEIQRLRSEMAKDDHAFAVPISMLSTKVLVESLEKNKHNRMAFEYLMAYYLLTIQLDKFAENLGRLDDFDYDRIPRLYEEAVLLYNSTGKKAELHGRKISRESQERFKNFSNTYLGRYGKNKEMAIGELTKNYGDSYFFYYVYGPSGMDK